MSGAAVVAAGWHDTYFRWDLSTPQRVVARLEALPGQGTLKSPGRKLFAERDRFGKWQHLLGDRHVLITYTVDSPKCGLIRRLELQAHLGERGEDDLCRVDEFAPRWQRLQQRMGFMGVLPAEEPVCVRVDPAVDVNYPDPLEGQRVLEGLRYARWPRGWHAEYQGPPPYTTVAVKHRTRTVARAYCRNTKLKNGGPQWGKIRFEREQRFEWRQGRPLDELARIEAASTYWGTAFGLGTAPGSVKRIRREVQAVKLIEQVQLGDISTAQYEQLMGFLDAERLGLTDRIYSPETARRRRKLAASLGIAPADAELDELDVSLDELLHVPRSAWAA
jgi:hypothetical protein